MKSSHSPIRHSFTRQLNRRFPASLASDDRGATAAFVAVGIVMMLGMVALAVDMGMLLGARTDSQRVADAAALAGAASFLTAPNDADRPRQWAIEYAAKNTVLGTTADVRAEDVDVLMAEKKVRVRVRNITARGNAIRTIFARVLGRDEVNVGTVAAAEVSPAGAGNCPLPLALPDRWTEDPHDDLYFGAPNDLYVRYQAGLTVKQCLANQQPPAPGLGGCDFTGFYPGSINNPLEPLVEIKVQSGPADPEDPDYVASPCTDGASWRCWFQPEAIDGGPSGGGANALAPWILGCPDVTLTIQGPPNPTILYAGSGAGNMQSLALDEFKNLIDATFTTEVWDNNHVAPFEWTEGHAYGCAVKAGEEGTGTCLNNRTSDRVRFMPLIDPSQVTGSGSGTQVPVAGLACVFVDKVATHMDSIHGQAPPPGQWNVYVRLTDTCIGVGSGTGTILKALRLVE